MMAPRVPLVIFVVFTALVVLATPACGGSSSSDDGNPAMTQLETLGIISITSLPAAHEGQFYYDIEAAFSESYDSGPDTECTWHDEANCTIQQCVANDSTVAFRATPAGSLTIEGGLFGTPGISVEPDGDHIYSHSGTIKPWEPGQKLIARAGGAQVPAFEVSVEAPGIFTLTHPELPTQGDLLSIRRTEPLELHWSNEAVDRVVAVSSSARTPAANPVASITCKFAASETEGRIPASALGVLPKGAGFLSAGTLAIGTSQAGARGILLIANGIARAASGGPAAVQATIE